MTGEAEVIDAYAVLGNPVSHSLSPRIHRLFADQTGESLNYSAIELPEDGFQAGLLELKHQGLRGANVTVPFKRQAWECCDHLSERASAAGAVNTLSFNADGSISGDNTDGVGLVRDLSQNLELCLQNQEILILGAGGAVRGVLGPLLDLHPGAITIANRSLDKAEQLALDFASRGEIRVLAYGALGEQHFDLVINATAAGLTDELPPLPESTLDAQTFCYDMVYNRQLATRFVAWARSHGARAQDGLGMLVEQAAESFFIWRGKHPQSGAVIKLLRQK